jgi:hypothetical protein
MVPSRPKSFSGGSGRGGEVGIPGVHYAQTVRAVGVDGGVVAGDGDGSSTPRVSTARRRLVGQLLMCDVLCANTYVFFLATCLSMRRLAGLAAVPLVFMVRVRVWSTALHS